MHPSQHLKRCVLLLNELFKFFQVIHHHQKQLKKPLRLVSSKIQASEILFKLLAEREGFEPSVRG